VTFTDIGVSQAFKRDQVAPQIRLTHREGNNGESTIVAVPKNSVIAAKKGAQISHL
jgi:hypothetical protein